PLRRSCCDRLQGMRFVVAPALLASWLALAGCREPRRDPPPPPATAATAATAEPVASASASGPVSRPPPAGTLELGDPPDLPVRDGKRSAGTAIEVHVLPGRRAGER